MLGTETHTRAPNDSQSILTSARFDLLYMAGLTSEIFHVRPHRQKICHRRLSNTQLDVHEMQRPLSATPLKCQLPEVTKININ